MVGWGSHWQFVFLSLGQQKRESALQCHQVLLEASWKEAGGLL